MFIVSLHYKRHLEEVDKHLQAHVSYLEEEFEKGNFIASGRKVPRTGGVILARAGSKQELVAILEKDPFYRAKIADYRITEFVPSMVAEGFEILKS